MAGSVIIGLGTKGPQGDQGAQGAQGAQGYQGVTGAQGTQGTSGAQGAQGYQGGSGAQGSQGTQGVQGAQGPQGASGGGGGSGETLKKTFTQVGNSFSVGTVVRYDNTLPSWVTAQANSAGNAEVFGVVDTAGDTFSVTMAGYISGLSGLTTAAGHFLSPSSAGALTSTDPTTTGHVSKPVLLALSTTEGIVQIQRGYVIP